MAGLVMMHLTLNGCDRVQMVNAGEISMTATEDTLLLQDNAEISVFEEKTVEEATEKEAMEKEATEEETQEEEAKEIRKEEVTLEAAAEEENAEDTGNQEKDTIETEEADGTKGEELKDKEKHEDMQEMKTEVFSDIAAVDFLEEVEQTEEIGYADFSLSVTEDLASVKAGERIGYEVYLENTGNMDLENLLIRAFFDNGNLNGEWQEAEGLSINQENGTALLSFLEAGASRTLVVMVDVGEDRQEDISAEFLVKTVHPQKNEEILNHSASMLTEIIPLTVDFSVSKWADRAVALPGDTILYQICIKNTGERTLHSVLTTEKFVNAGVQAQFQEKEGVILNGSKTQALISEIKPGEAFGLNALVTIPENMESGELLNEVIVMTAETGEQKFTAQAEVEILESAVTEIPKETTETGAALEVSDIPKTEDLSETELWAGTFGIACLIILVIYWIQKAKRKR